MFEDADNFADSVFRGGLPILMTLILIICSSNAVLASSEFTVYRMSQFDLNGIAYGCRASALSLEAKSLYTWSTGRHCVVAKLQDITIDQFREIRQKAGGLVLLLPNDVNSMSSEEKHHINLLEQAMLSQPSSIPIYFTEYNVELEKIVGDITYTSIANAKQNNSNDKSTQRQSALTELFASISANGYQVVVSGASHASNKNSKIPIIQGELVPFNKHMKVESNGEAHSKNPLIIITAHLKTSGLYNEYPLNADTAVLLSLAEVFGKLHQFQKTTAKKRILFLLSESGPLSNFQGVKKWLDDNTQLQNVDFVLCLDTITQALSSDTSSLYMHVSKPPKELSSIANFFKLLKSVASRYGDTNIEGVHKKINLADQVLAWEHERFSMKRLPAFTLSALKTPKDPVRTTIFTDNEDRIINNLQRNTKIIAESLAHYIYNIEEDPTLDEIFSDTLQIDEQVVRSYLNIKSALHNNDLKNSFEKYLTNVKINYDKPDIREPDFMFYDGQQARLNVYHVKPAVFDLFLTILICAYLLAIYFVIQHFNRFYDFVCKLTTSQTFSSNGNISYNERSKMKYN